GGWRSLRVFFSSVRRHTRSNRDWSSDVCSSDLTAATLISAPFDWLAQAIGQAASWIFQGVWALFDSTTLVDISGGGYIGVYNVIFGIAIFLMLIFFCLQLITGLIRRDPGAPSRAALGL